MKLTIGFSPCPNDTFIFDALVNGKIDTQGIAFDPVLEDVQTLNEWALEGKLDITKLSFPTYFAVKDQYALLQAGSALGKGVGPLLITKDKETLAVDGASIALPGVNTTAHLLFSFAYPNAQNKNFSLFSDIENEVLNGKHDMGVIIHENRFTYADRGLQKIADLGAVWEQKMQVPIPLGGIVIKKEWGEEKYGVVNALIKESLAYSWQQYPAISAYVQTHAQAMREAVMRQHIELYVNDYTANLGVDGLKAIEVLNSVYDILFKSYEVKKVV